MYTSQYLVSEIEKHMGKIDVIEPKKLWNIQNKQIHHIHTVFPGPCSTTGERVAPG